MQTARYHYLKKQVTNAILISWEETSQAHITSKLDFTD